MPRIKSLFASPSREAAEPASPASRLASRRNLALIAFALLTLTAIVIVAIVREAAPRRAATPPAITPSPSASRPPLTSAEEAYIQALWPIHGAVERSSARMTLGQIFYMTKDLERTELKARVDEALTTYRRAGGQLRALEPPPSLQGAHAEYTVAVGLFERSAVEVLKMFDDGRDEHMRIASPLSREAVDKIREVGVKFWPHEFPPN